ncbi:hypothetical protein GCM10025331_64660 [Actinoplanes utahensis]|nr:hypothetical protein Aut01nite_42200 [Actinoplanes utahensis]
MTAAATAITPPKPAEVKNRSQKSGPKYLDGSASTEGAEGVGSCGTPRRWSTDSDTAADTVVRKWHPYIVGPYKRDMEPVQQ